MKDHSKIARMSAFALTLFGLSAISSGPAHSDNKHDSTVKAAAHEKLRAKLGDIRGTISIRDRQIFLTRKMIEQWKPVGSRANRDGG